MATRKMYASVLRESLNGVSLNKSTKTAIDKLAAKEEELEIKLEELKSIKEALNQKSVDLAKAEALLEAEKLEASNKIAAFEREYEKSLDMQQELKDLKSKMVTSYSTEDISNYLNQVIKDFNASNESDNSVATYVINNMDVDLKVRIYGDEKDSLRFTAPSITETTEDSLSSIKISIQAVPK